MQHITVVGDVGSTHMSNMHYCKEAIDLASDVGLDFIKFQLFPDILEYTKCGNMVFPLPWHNTWPELNAYAKEKGVNLTASVFTREAFELACKMKPKFVKFGYSMKDEIVWQGAAENNYHIPTVVSCDVMSYKRVHLKSKKLWVHTTQHQTNYPVHDEPVHDEISFDGLFPGFTGFSDNTLGFRQTKKAIDAGALWIEKHVRLEHMDVDCPDAAFAVTFKEIGRFISELNNIRVI